VALFGIGYPIVNMIGDWKQAFLIFTLPINIIALILSAKFTPPGEAPRSNITVFSAYRRILRDKSALGCLIGNGFGLAALSIMPSLSASYFRETYGIARGLVIYIIIAMCFANVVGSLTVRRFSRGVGYKKTMIFFTLIQGVLTFLMFAEFGTTISLVFGLLAALVNGMYSPTAIGLVMEQFPELRGAVLSLNAAFGSIGGMLGLSVSGFLLLEYSWRIMGVLPIFLGMVSGLVVYLLVRGIHLQPLSQ
jgi:predicted MFS family arabinose efflux permease